MTKLTYPQTLNWFDIPAEEVHSKYEMALEALEEIAPSPSQVTFTLTGAHGVTAVGADYSAAKAALEEEGETVLHYAGALNPIGETILLNAHVRAGAEARQLIVEYGAGSKKDRDQVRERFTAVLGEPLV